MVALCSKTYVIQNSKEGHFKLSCKGINKKFVQDPLAIMTGVLENQTRQLGVNRGFRARDNTMYTYSQQRVGFRYFYCKRKVEDDGIHTSPLDLVLSPWPDFNRFVFKNDWFDSLCHTYDFDFYHGETKFLSIEHFISYSMVEFHKGKDEAWLVQMTESQTDIPKFQKGIKVKLLWYEKLKEILNVALQVKLLKCVEFKAALQSIVYNEIVYADKDMFLGCGMDYNVAILTKSCRYPGQNILGEMLSDCRKEITHVV